MIMSRSLILVCLAIVGSNYAGTVDDFKAPEVTLEENGDVSIQFFHEEGDLPADRQFFGL